MIITRTHATWLQRIDQRLLPIHRWLAADPDRIVGVAAAIVALAWLCLEIWEMP